MNHTRRGDALLDCFAYLGTKGLRMELTISETEAKELLKPPPGCRFHLRCEHNTFRREITPMVEISVAAVERNKAWIEAVTSTLKNSGDSELSRLAMRNAGKKCAAQLLEKIVAHFGRKPQSVDEFIEAINKRRKEVLRASNLWEREGNRAYFRLDKCGCDLVEAGLAEPNPVFCLCSSGMFENLFAPFCRGTVRTEIVKAIGLGDECCEFVVHFDE